MTEKINDVFIKMFIVYEIKYTIFTIQKISSKFNVIN